MSASQDVHHIVGPLRGRPSHKKRGRKANNPDLSRDEARAEQDDLTRRSGSKRPRFRYLPEHLAAALEELGECHLPLLAVARKWGIPQSTLHNKANQKHTNLIGRPYMMNQESEEQLARMVVRFCSKGCPITFPELTTIVLAYAEHHPTAIPNFKASPEWMAGFIERSKLKQWEEGKTKILGIHRRIAARECVIEAFIKQLFEIYRLYLSALSEYLGKGIPDLLVHEISDGIFGIDETSLSNRTPTKYEPVKMVSKSGKGGVQALQSICRGQSTVAATLMEVFCANGTSPFHVLTTKVELTSAKKLTLGCVNPDTELFFVSLDSGNFNSNSHSQVLRKIGSLRGGKPSLVIQDCPKMHTTELSLVAARQSNIFLLGLPHNSSWFLQQADDLPFMLNKAKHYQHGTDISSLFSS